MNTLTFSLVSNTLAGTEGYRAMVRHAGSAGFDDVVDQIIRQGSTVTRADILSVLEDYHAAIEHLLSQGFRVNTPLANFGLSVKGTFADTEGGFDPACHRVAGRVSAGKRLRAFADTCGSAMRKVLDVPRPVIEEYVDILSGERNGAITPGGVGRLLGTRLKFDPADEIQGVFIVGEDGTATRASVMVQNQPRELIFVVPDTIPPGSCQITVRTLFGNEVRAGTLRTSLTA